MSLWSDLRRNAERSDPLAFNEWINMFSYNGLAYNLLGQTIAGQTQERVGDDFVGLARGAFKSDPTIFACEMVRLSIFSEATFKFRRYVNGRPGELFGSTALAQLEAPWPGATTGDLLGRMLVHHDLAGNAFVARRFTKKSGRTLRLLRPDWVTIISGSEDAKVTSWDIDAEVIGYMYHPGGRHSGRDPELLMPEDVAHFATIPDPEAPFRGMSWMQPVVREIMGDKAATEHKLSFFENGATPNMVVKLDVTDPEKFKIWEDMFQEKYAGNLNAYKTLFLGAGADATVVGSQFDQIDFRSTQGKHETRIASDAGVPAVIVGISEGLEGSSLNAGNYGQARRRLADVTMRPLWRNAAGSLAKLIDVPAGASLWYDDRDIPFLRDDVNDVATILKAQAASIRQLVDAGYEAASVVSAVTANDLTRLVHTGLFSVQLQPPGTQETEEPDPEAPDDAPDPPEGEDT